MNEEDKKPRFVVEDYSCTARIREDGRVAVKFACRAFGREGETGDKGDLILDFSVEEARVIASRILAACGSEMDRLGLV